MIVEFEDVVCFWVFLIFVVVLFVDRVFEYIVEVVYVCFEFL